MIDEAYPEYEVKYLKSEAGPFSVAKFMTLYQAKEYLADLKKNGMNGIILQGPRPVKVLKQKLLIVLISSKIFLSAGILLMI